MNKLRILSNNMTLDKTVSLASYVYKYQRFFIQVPVFGVGDVFTTGAIVKNVGVVTNPVNGAVDYIDVLLPSDTMLFPNPTNQTPVVLITNTGISITAVFGDRIVPNKAGFTEKNIVDVNRNRVLLSRNSLENNENSYPNLSIRFSMPPGVIMAQVVDSFFIINHNISNTATITVSYFDVNGLLIAADAITGGNLELFNNSTNYYFLNTSNTVTNFDSDNFYQSKKMLKLYSVTGKASVNIVQVDIEDTNNTDSLYVGNIYIGDRYEVVKNFNDAWSIDLVDPSITTYAQSPYSVTKQSFDLISLKFNSITSDEKQFWLDLYKKHGTFSDIILDMFDGSADLNNNYYMVYGRFVKNRFRIINNFLDKFSVSLSIRESI